MNANRCCIKVAIALIAMAMCVGRTAHADGFLWLPFVQAYSPHVTCHWSCLNDDGTIYNHRATDFGRTGMNTEVRAAAEGIVIRATDGLLPKEDVRNQPYGNHVRIRHNNRYETRYAHLLTDSIVVAVGDHVHAGQLLGYTDNTGRSSGPHLHFEVRNDHGVSVNPYGDPPSYPDEGGDGCGPHSMWATCPPTTFDVQTFDNDRDGFTPADGDCDDWNDAVYPGGTERCDNADNDCDGIVDNAWHSGLSTDVGNPCGVGTGACRGDGVWMCEPGGRGVVCGAMRGSPLDERCDGIDNDCDGDTDEDWPLLGDACSITWSSCVGSTDGVYVCASGGRGSVCDAPPLATTPTDIVDADGDGELCDTDCNDHDNAIHHHAEEIPGDGIDQNCSEGDLGDCPAAFYEVTPVYGHFDGSDCVGTTDGGYELIRVFNDDYDMVASHFHVPEFVRCSGGYGARWEYNVTVYPDMSTPTCPTIGLYGTFQAMYLPEQDIFCGHFSGMLFYCGATCDNGRAWFGYDPDYPMNGGPVVESYCRAMYGVW